MRRDPHYREYCADESKTSPALRFSSWTNLLMPSRVCAAPSSPQLKARRCGDRRCGISARHWKLTEKMIRHCCITSRATSTAHLTQHVDQSLKMFIRKLTEHSMDSTTRSGRALRQRARVPHRVRHLSKAPSTFTQDFKIARAHLIFLHRVSLIKCLR